MINISFTVNDANFSNPATFALTGGTITGGTGAYAGATGSLTLNFTRAANGVLTTTGSGSVTVGGKATPLTLTNFQGASGSLSERDYSNGTVTGTVSPLGNVTGTFRVDNTESNLNQSLPSLGIIRLALNGTDSFNVFFSVDTNGNVSPEPLCDRRHGSLRRGHRVIHADQPDCRVNFVQGPGY